MSKIEQIESRLMYPQGDGCWLAGIQAKSVYLAEDVDKMINILQVTERQLTRGMTSTERKHTLQHITDILGDKTTL